MLPEAQIGYTVVGGRVLPHYLGRGDAAWVEHLTEEYLRFVGRPRKLLEQRLKQPLPAHVPRRESALVARVLDRIFPTSVRSERPPPAVRAAVFEKAAAAGPDDSRKDVLARAALCLGIDPAAVDSGLYADVPGERVLVAPAHGPAAADIIRQANLLLAQSILARSRQVAVELDSGTRPSIRTARLLGLICTVTDRPPRLFADRACRSWPAHPTRKGVFLTVSGPLTLFRHTLKYGRALARFLSALAWAPRWRLAADCLLAGRVVRFEASHGDGLAPASDPPRSFDSAVEEQFFRDFRKLTTEWEVLREPRPIRSGDGYIFPDFALVPRIASGKPILVEVVGYWTPEYLDRKLRRWGEARVDPVILCVDQNLSCGERTWPAGSRVIFYKKRIDPEPVLALANTFL